MAEKPADDKAAEEAAAAKAENDALEAELESFDKDRALSTIRAQRKAEKELKAELAEAKKAKAELDRINAEKEDADKSATEKLASRDARIAELENQISEGAIKSSFLAEAASDERAYASPDLAYLAAEKAGLLGKYDPKTGQVGAHDFDKLEELHPTLAGEGAGEAKTGDAGVRGKPGKTGTPGSAFNASVRKAVSRR